MNSVFFVDFNSSCQLVKEIVPLIKHLMYYESDECRGIEN